LSKTAFETEFLESQSKDMVITKLRDVFLPQECRVCNKIHLPKNPYDMVIFKSPSYLVAELKSGKQKSFSLNEKIIKSHQIKSLNKYKDYKNCYCGFIFNFVSYDNQTFFLHIDDFNLYVSTTTAKSIPLKYIEENGIKIDNKIKKIKYHYFIDKLFEDLEKKYER